MDVSKIRKSNLCLSCEICNAVCPTEAIKMEFEGGQFLPVINREKCIDCRLCFDLCPGSEIREIKTGVNVDFESKITGSYLDAYSVFTNDWDLWKESTSGGVITQLTIDLLKADEYDGAFVLNFDMFDTDPARLTLAKSEKEVKAAAKSKYIPASVYNIIKVLDQESSPNYIIVGTPCQIKGLKKFIEKSGIGDEELLFLGLFCDKTLNFNFLHYIEEKHSKEGENLVNFDYRNKEKDGWPGSPKLYFDSGREKIIDRSERTKVKKYFQLERCLYCLDKLNKNADISFGDCYIAGKDEPGKSNIIIRTEKGKDVWESHKNSFDWEKVSIESIKKSQSISKKKENLKFSQVLKESENHFDGNSNEKIDKKVKKDLSKRKKHIRWGRNNEYGKIERSISFPNLKKYKNFFRAGIGIGGFFIKDFFSDITKKRKKPKERQNIIIIGAHQFNKGAQAMTFTVVDQMKRRFPDKGVYLFHTKDFKRDELEKERYNFEIKPWDVRTKINLLSSEQTFKGNNYPFSSQYDEIEDIIRESIFILDISGYALSSQMGNPNSLIPYKEFSYILDIVVAKNFNIPYYILPQSIGPFNYSIFEKVLLNHVMKKYLRYPDKIYPREKDGVDSIKKYTQKNVEQARDIVLMNEGYNLNNLFSSDTELKSFDISPNTVGIIPNSQVMKRSEPEQIYSLYESIINKLLNHGKNIYIMRHSHEDFQICKKIKEKFLENDNVELIIDELNAVELEDIISQMDFIIGSRYHSIIHAYKNGIPALILGWAIKYHELANDFNQLEYHLDSRDELDKRIVLRKLEKLINNYKKEQSTLEARLKEIREGRDVNPFDEIGN